MNISKCLPTKLASQPLHILVPQFPITVIKHPFQTLSALALAHEKRPNLLEEVSHRRRTNL
jgi:hypothetical protein